jgi:hypothetical protein
VHLSYSFSFHSAAQASYGLSILVQCFCMSVCLVVPSAVTEIILSNFFG